MAGIIKRIMRHFNGTDWDKYYPETSADQVKFTKADGTETDIQKELSGVNSTLTNFDNIEVDGQNFNFQHIRSEHTDVADALKESLVDRPNLYPIGITFAVVNASSNYGCAIIQKANEKRQSFLYFNYWGDNGLWVYTDNWKQITLK